METDEILVERALAGPEGDTRAFESLMQRHQASVLANCRYLTRSPDDAEDLAQEVFVKTYFNLASFEGRSKFKTWVHRIKINHCLNFLKKKKGRQFLDVDEPALADAEQLKVNPAAHRDTVAGEERRRIREALAAMNDTTRIPLVLCDLDGLSYQEIADTLGLGLSAVKMRIKRGREEFRRLYDRQDDASPPDRK